MQTIKNYTHITQNFCLYLKLKKIKNYRKPHIEQNNHNLHYNKGKFSAFFFKKTCSCERCQSKSLLTINSSVWF